MSGKQWDFFFLKMCAQYFCENIFFFLASCLVGPLACLEEHKNTKVPVGGANTRLRLPCVTSSRVHRSNVTSGSKLFELPAVFSTLLTSRITVRKKPLVESNVSALAFLLLAIAPLSARGKVISTQDAQTRLSSRPPVRPVCPQTNRIFCLKAANSIHSESLCQ